MVITRHYIATVCLGAATVKTLDSRKLVSYVQLWTAKLILSPLQMSLTSVDVSTIISLNCAGSCKVFTTDKNDGEKLGQTRMAVVKVTQARQRNTLKKPYEVQLLFDDLK